MKTTLHFLFLSTRPDPRLKTAPRCVAFLLLFLSTFFSSGCGTLTWASLDISDQIFDLGLNQKGSSATQSRPEITTEYQAKVKLSDDPPAYDLLENPAAPLAEEEPITERPHNTPVDPTHVENPLQGTAEPETEQAEVHIEVHIPSIELPTLAPPKDNQDIINDEPIGPPLGVSAARLQCKLQSQNHYSVKNEKERFLKWPWIFTIAMPSSLLGSIAALGLVFWAIGPNPPMYMMMSASAAWLLYFVGDIAAASTLVGRKSDFHRESESEITAWADEPNPCAGAILYGNGFEIQVAPDGRLDPWDEAYAVRAWIAGRGPTHVRIQNVELRFEVSALKRCRWAFERGYEMPAFCQANF